MNAYEWHRFSIARGGWYSPCEGWFFYQNYLASKRMIEGMSQP